MAARERLTWIVDLQHFLDAWDPELVFEMPAPARRLGQFFGRIVEAASAGPEDPGETIFTALRCRRRPGRRPCPGRIVVRLESHSGELQWECPECDDHGFIHGWQGTPCDHWSLADPEQRAQRDPRSLLLSADEFDALIGIEWLDPAARRVLALARTDEDGDIVIDAPESELEHLLAVSAREAVRTKNPARRALLAALADLE